jgi:RNA polymerase sigma-70 factor (ECF subfamily)
MELNELLAHAGWVRRVATSLVHDPGAADDLAQEVWLRGLERRPADLASPQAWLATVARSLARTGARGTGRRRARERDAARPEALPAVDAVVAEAEREREVAALVLTLEEPYRSVVLLRFYRDLPPRRIAAELGRPVATVKVQLQRGLAQLRTQLDRRHGARETWAALLLPLCVPRAPVAALAGSAAALVLLLGALAVGWNALTRAPKPATRPALAAALHPTPVESVPLAPASTRAPAEVARAEPLSPSDPASSAPVPSERAIEVLHARLVTPAGEPLAGVRVAARDPRQLRWAAEGGALVADGFWLPLTPARRAELARSPDARVAFLAEHFLADGPLAREACVLLEGRELPQAEARTNALGAFQLEVRPGSRALELREEALALVGSGRPEQPIGVETLLFLAAPAMRVEGRVLDARGGPCAGVLVEHTAAYPDAAGGLIRRGDTLLPVSTTTRTDGDGRFVLERLPATAGGWLSATRDGAGTGRALDLSCGSPPDDLTLVLWLEPEPERLRIVGTVLRPDGAPATEAHVVLAGTVTTTDEAGTFELVPSSALDGADLFVVEEGYDPLVLPGFGTGLAGPGTLSAGVLRLPATRLALSGRVIDADGNPLGVVLELLDATHVDGLDRTLEQAASSRPFRTPTTAADGTFELRGLLDREYRLRAGWTEFGPFAAGQRDLLLVLPR